MQKNIFGFLVPFTFWWECHACKIQISVKGAQEYCERGIKKIQIILQNLSLFFFFAEDWSLQIQISKNHTSCCCCFGRRHNLVSTYLMHERVTDLLWKVTKCCNYHSYFLLDEEHPHICTIVRCICTLTLQAIGVLWCHSFKYFFLIF